MPIDSTPGAITGIVSSDEVFTVNAAVTEILTDRPALLADDADGFERLAREVLTRTRPGHTDGFADIVVRTAWSRRRTQVGRLALSAPALAQLEQLIAHLPEADTTSELRAEVTGATQRLNWTGAAPTPGASRNDDGPEANG